MVRRVGRPHSAAARNIGDVRVVESYGAKILFAPEQPQAEAEVDIPCGAQVDASARVHAQWR
jgi:hypothetical protein